MPPSNFKKRKRAAEPAPPAKAAARDLLKGMGKGRAVEVEDEELNGESEQESVEGAEESGEEDQDGSVGGGDSEDSGLEDESDEGPDEDEEEEEDAEEDASEADSSAPPDASTSSLKASSALPTPSAVRALPSRIPSRIAASRVAAASSSTTAPAPASTKPDPSHSTPSLTFASLGVSPPLVAALNNMSIRRPTDIQVACLGPILSGRDCIGSAKTGSGKTVAFALPILQALSKDPYGIFALVLTPTRELAFQIADQFHALGGHLNLSCPVIVGGLDMMTQALALKRKPHVVVATPGRLVDLLKSAAGELDLSRLRYLVLDEADRLLSDTFAPELGYLFGQLPKQRQTLLFTATVTPAIMALRDRTPQPGKEKPFVHLIESDTTTVSTLSQHYVHIPSHIREPYLYHLLLHPPASVESQRHVPPDLSKPTPTSALSAEPAKKKRKRKPRPARDPNELQPVPTIIFAQRCETAAQLTHMLQHLRVRCTPLHSRLSQQERLHSLGLFRGGVVPVLVATDVGSRGLDIPEVAMVINFDVPRSPEDYVHRVGRTARAGRGGVAVSFVGERDVELVHAIEERIGTQLIEHEMSETKVLENLNAVFTAKRVATMALHDSKFGEREEIHKKKVKKRQKLESRAAAEGAS